MVREEIKQQRGKFYIRRKTKFAERFYQDSGITDVGTPDQQPYVRWTGSTDFAYAFMTVKTAKSMAKNLHQLTGARMEVVDRNGEVY